MRSAGDGAALLAPACNQVFERIHVGRDMYAPAGGEAASHRHPSGATDRRRPAESADPSASCFRPCGSRRRETSGRRDRRRAQAMRASWGRLFKHESRLARVPGAGNAQRRAAERGLDRPGRLAAGAAAAAAFPIGGGDRFRRERPKPAPRSRSSLQCPDRPRSPAGCRGPGPPAPGRAAAPPQAENSSTRESSAPSNISRSAAPTGSTRTLSMRA